MRTTAGKRGIYASTLAPLPAPLVEKPIAVRLRQAFPE